MVLRRDSPDLFECTLSSHLATSEDHFPRETSVRFCAFVPLTTARVNEPPRRILCTCEFDGVFVSGESWRLVKRPLKNLPELSYYNNCVILLLHVRRTNSTSKGYCFSGFPMI